MMTFDQCVTELVITKEHRAALQLWDGRAARDPVTGDLQRMFNGLVRGFTHDVLFQIHPEEIAAIARVGEHPLGSLQKGVDTLPEVDNFRTPFAFSYFFHDLLEQLGRVPLWGELWDAMFWHPYDDWYYALLLDALRSRHSERRIMRAFRWRLGLYYYSALREVYILSSLRSRYGIPLQYHLFADLVLRVDGWAGDRLLYLRVPNNYEPRKIKPASGDTFQIVKVPVRQPTESFGRLWLPSNISEIAGWMEA